MNADAGDARLEAMLRAADEEEREILRESRLELDPPGAERVARVVREHAARDRRRRAGKRGLAVIAAAAAIVLAATLLPRLGRSGAERGVASTALGGQEDLRPVSPVGAGERLAPFVWRVDPSSTAVRFEVLVYAGPPPGAPPSAPRGRLLARSPRLAASSWNPDSEEVSKWPDSIRWEVRAFDISGELAGACEAQASRSSSR